MCVSDLLLLGRATIEETRTLLYWLEKEEGYKKLGVCGLSMGTWAITYFVIFLRATCILNLSFNSMGFFVWNWSPMTSHWLVCIQFQYSLAISCTCLDIVLEFE